jgi:hypothetical protein
MSAAAGALVPAPPPSAGAGSRGRSGGYSDDEDEGCTDELIDRILENYTFTFKPEARIKLKQRFESLSLGLCYARPWERDPRWRLTLKPNDRESGPGRYVRSLLLVPQLSTAAAFSARIPLGVFRLQCVLSYNWARRAPSLEYRLTTKWSDGARIRRKERFVVSDRCAVRAKWNLDAHLPDMEGHVGGGGNALDVDYGSMAFDVSQIDLCLDIS